MFLYSDTQPRGDFKGDIWKMNANKSYLRHYDNLLYLRFLAANGTFAEKRQAEKEIEICERKLKFWERHPNYVEDMVKPEKEKRLKDWKGRI